MLVLLLAVGCDRAGSSSAATSATPAEVRLGYFGNVTHAQAVLGTSSKEFERAVEPAKFTPTVFNAGPSLIEALLTGNLDIGYVGPGPALSASDKTHQQGIRVIAGAAANGVLIVARKNSGIKTLRDLRGRKLGTPQQGNTQDIAARHYLSRELGQSDTNNVMPVANFEQLSMLRLGQIDAAWTPEPWGSRLLIESDSRLIAEEKDLWPGKRFALAVIVTTPEFLARYPQVVKQILRVHLDWTSKLQDHPQQYADQLGEALAALNGGKKLPAAVLVESLKHVEFTTDPLPETFNTMGGWAFDLGFARQAPKLEGLFDMKLLDEVRKR
jgi:NitT/TauT family transport system substrate-binding protein